MLFATPVDSGDSKMKRVCYFYHPYSYLIFLLFVEGHLTTNNLIISLIFTRRG